LPENRVKRPLVDFPMKHDGQNLPSTRSIVPQFYVTASLGEFFKTKN
jgi:hypothetical protein